MSHCLKDLNRTNNKRQNLFQILNNQKIERNKENKKKRKFAAIGRKIKENYCVIF
jgi:hypothetical protein